MFVSALYCTTTLAHPQRNNIYIQDNVRNDRHPPLKIMGDQSLMVEVEVENKVVIGSPMVEVEVYNELARGVNMVSVEVDNEGVG